MKNIRSHVCIGGTRTVDDQAKLSGGVQVVVGTPGRVMDMINRGILSKLFSNGSTLSVK